MKISIHPLFFAAIIASAVFGGFLACIIAALTALLHECGHVFCAARFGYRCEKIRIMPYGAVAVCEIDGIRAKEEVLLALSGPAVNCVICLILGGLWWFFPSTYAFTDVIMWTSLGMLLFNLLPAYPLDGGRVAKCVLARFLSPRAVKITLRAINVLAAAALVAVFFACGYNLTFLCFALFLLFAIFEKSPPAVKINYSTSATLKRGMEVKTILVGEDLTVLKALRFLDEKKYVILRTPSGRQVEQDELLKIIEERSMYDRVFEDIQPNN